VILRSIVFALHDALRFFDLLLEDEIGFQLLLARHGWDATLDSASIATIRTAFALQPLLDSASDIAEDLQSGIGDEITLIGQLLDVLILIIERLRNLGAAPLGGLPFPLDQPNFWSEFPSELLDELTITYLREEQPILFGFFYLIGVIHIERVEPPGAGRIAYQQQRLNWGQLSDFITEPSGVFKALYHWGDDIIPFDHGRLLRAIEQLFLAFRIPVRRIPPRQDLATTHLTPTGITQHRVNELDVPLISGILPNDTGYIDVGLGLLPIPNPPGMTGPPEGLLLTPLIRGGGGLSFPLSRDFSLNLSGGFENEQAVILRIFPDRTDLETATGGTMVEAQVVLVGKPDSPWLLLGGVNSHRVEVGGVEVGLRVTGPVSDPEIMFEAVTGDGPDAPKVAVVIKTSEADSFLNTVLDKKPIRVEFSGGVTWSSKHGLTLQGQGGLEGTIGVHKSIGSVHINSLFLSIRAQNENATLTSAVSGNATLGPLTVTVDKIGLRLLLEARQGNKPPGNFGTLNLDFGFKPPDGLGLSIDGGGFKGSGFLEFHKEDERYEGILQLEFQNRFTLTAIGLLTTGQQGFSLLIIISSTEFTPIQLGFGFTLTGVGGLLSLNRTMDVERLREGIKTNSLDHILFPTDPIANAARIISDLSQVFPPQEGRFVFGPMAQIGWGTPPLITGEVGLFIEVPSPIRVALPGVIKALLPDEEQTLLQLQVNFLGTWEEDKQLIAFDASLFDSRLLNLTLAGDMALRLAYGEHPNFLATVGGFHPAYAPPPLALPPLARLTVHLTRGDNPRLVLAAYFALTSNTAQFGAKIELLAKAGKFNVYGFLAFDALFQFSPFRFIVAIGGEVAVRVGSSVLFSIGLKLTLSGPTPWNAKGTASFKILFFKKKVRFDKTWGEERDTTLPDVAVLPKLVAALQHKNNWQAQLPPRHHLLVSIRDMDDVDAADIVAHPAGVLTVSQKVVPLDTPIDRFGSQKPADARRFTIETGPQFNTSTVEEFFAPAQFEELDDAQRLSRPSFEKMPAGVKMSSTTTDIQTSKVVGRNVTYETIILDTRSRRLPLGKFFGERLGTFSALLRGNAVAKSRLSFVNNAEPVLGPGKIAVAQEGYTVVGTADLSPFDGNASFGSETGAQRYMQELIQQHPALVGQLQVVPNSEVFTAG
jgi:hypothetical protein